ncbi:NAD-dependent epimerase/dehydratase family protein [Blastococcus mobilis]|uniref:Nucleoside-diphosphate-sugar epimerase n=1 Tax=Blastococcus mobilis TaxID=1938746 RepID=A0A238UTW9_9ACTN|nr:NAD-dependent epimerase/dehydratase family protein [Blastococcus mobilis]SNR25436.1 Nucleoside-diphosphate-sugar epimerase [Blastococcus mobilis]
MTRGPRGPEPEPPSALRTPAPDPAASGGSDVHVVVGAGGAVGRLVVAHLHAAGARVRAVTRNGRDVGTPDVECVAADARDGAALTAACRGAASVYHCVMPVLGRWTEQFPVITDALVEAASTVGARLVYADDTWMYDRVRGPMAEETPWRPVSTKGVLRAWIAERMLHAAAGGRLQVSIARAGELYGPGVRSLIAGNVFASALRGRPVHWVGDADLPLTPTYVDDFARTVAVLGLQDGADAAVSHVPHPEPTTGRTLAAEACRQAGTRLVLLRHGSRQVRALGWFLPLAREGAELVYQFEQPFVVDGRRAADAFGLVPTSYEYGVRRTLSAIRAAEPGPGVPTAAAGGRDARGPDT